MYKSTTIILAVFLIFLFSFCNKKPVTEQDPKMWSAYYSDEDLRKDSINYTGATVDTVTMDAFIEAFNTDGQLIWSTFFGPPRNPKKEDHLEHLLLKQ